jgi:hypothetical protein
MIGMNPITTKNNTIVSLHLDDKECSSKRLAPNGEFHGDDTSSLHRVAPDAVKHQVGLHNLITPRPSFLKTECGIKLTTTPPSMSLREIDLSSM